MLNAWVRECADDMEAANDVGNTRKLHSLVKILSGKVDKKPAVDLQVDRQGEPILSAQKRGLQSGMTSSRRSSLRSQLSREGRTCPHYR